MYIYTYLLTITIYISGVASGGGGGGGMPPTGENQRKIQYIKKHVFKGL